MSLRTSSRLFLFDLDGTLVDSAPDIARALNVTLSEVGVPRVTPARVAGFIGDGAQKLIERSLPRGAKVRVAALVERFRSNYAAALCVDTRPYPGVHETLHALSNRGVRLAVLTNKPSDLARALIHVLGLDRLISDVVGDGDGFPRKPAPEAARHLLSRAEADEDRTWLIGDGLPDMQLGRALGCKVAAVSWGYTPRALLAAERPHRILDRPSEMLTLLERPTLAP